jgi:hypothetical protein
MGKRVAVPTAASSVCTRPLPPPHHALPPLPHPLQVVNSRIVHRSNAIAAESGQAYGSDFKCESRLSPARLCSNVRQGRAESFGTLWIEPHASPTTAPSCSGLLSPHEQTARPSPLSPSPSPPSRRRSWPSAAPSWRSARCAPSQCGGGRAWFGGGGGVCVWGGGGTAAPLRQQARTPAGSLAFSLGGGALASERRRRALAASWSRRRSRPHSLPCAERPCAARTRPTGGCPARERGPAGERRAARRRLHPAVLPRHDGIAFCCMPLRRAHTSNPRLSSGDRAAAPACGVGATTTTHSRCRAARSPRSRPQGHHAQRLLAPCGHWGDRGA